MRELSQHEASMVSAGEVSCTVGNDGKPCPGISSYGDTYDRLVGAVTDMIEKLAAWWNN